MVSGLKKSMAGARSRTGPGAGRRCRCRRIATGYRGRCGGRICRCARGRRDCGCTAALEVGGIPACAFELETRGCELFAEFGGTAGWAFCQGCIGHFLQHILSMAAGVALVGVNGHEEGSFQVGNTKLSIIGGGRCFKPLRSPATLRTNQPSCGECHADCEWPDGPASRSACPPNWQVPPPAEPEIPRQRA